MAAPRVGGADGVKYLSPRRPLGVRTLARVCLSVYLSEVSRLGERTMIMVVREAVVREAVARDKYRHRAQTQGSA